MAAAAAVTFCTEEPNDDSSRSMDAEASARLNVVLVLVDTLRADHLGIYGYERATSPQIDVFARKSLVFANARSQAPCTFPSVNSLLTSRDPSVFLGREAGDVGIPESATGLAEVFAANGYRTAAFSTSPIVRKAPSPHNLVGGFDRGFDVFDERCFRKPAGCVNKRALAHLDGVRADDKPFFLYLHYLDPHGPYRPPKGFKRRFSTGYEGKDFIESGDPNPIAKMIYNEGAPRIEFAPEDIAHLVDLYDDEIAYFDTQFRMLLDGLEQRGLLDQSIVVLLSDHGEDFLERSDIKHCRSLYETQTRIPIIMRIPGVAGGARFTEAVGNIDVAPTLLDFTQIDASALGYDGRSLRPLIQREFFPEPMVFSAWRSSRSVVAGSDKFLLDRRTNIGQLFDVRADPLEGRDLSLEKPEVAARLRSAIESRLAQFEEDLERSIDEGERASEQLKALGYLE